MREENYQAELYVKENNLLQLSLFHFGRRKLKKTIVKWEDQNGTYSLKCVSDVGVPGSLEQDVYTACMRSWVEQKMPEGKILISYSEIARILKLDPQSSVVRIKNSLKKLGEARYTFEQCFVKADKSGNKKETTMFSLFDTASLFEHKDGLSKKNSISELVFPDAIRDNLVAQYYQRLDMGWYRSLPEGLPRRLYEYLAKRSYHKNKDNVFVIGEEAICRWLPMYDKHSTNRRRRLKDIAEELIEVGFLKSYSFNKTKKQCVFVFAENALPPKEMEESKDKIIVVEKEKPLREFRLEAQKQQIVFVEAIEWVKSIPYFHKKKQQEIFALPIPYIVESYIKIRADYECLVQKNGTPKPSWIYSQFVGKVEVSKKEPIKKLPAPKQADLFEQPREIEEKVIEIRGNIEDLLKQIKGKKVSNKLRGEIEKYLQHCGFNYVKNSILYTNEKAKKNYSSYLQQTLQYNWAEEWAEEEKPKIEKKQKRQQEAKKQEEKQREEERQKKMIKEKAEGQKPFFEQMFGQLNTDIKNDLWEKAKQSELETSNHLPMNIGTTRVQLEFMRLVLAYFNKDREIFVSKVISEVFFVKELAKEYTL